jgi:hypothetical protein
VVYRLFDLLPGVGIAVEPLVGDNVGHASRRARAINSVQPIEQLKQLAPLVPIAGI